LSLPTESSHILVVAQQNPLASDNNPGTETRPLQSINAAVERAQPGDKIVVHEGIYRERVMPARSGQPNRPIVYEAAPGETVILRGSEVWTA